MIATMAIAQRALAQVTDTVQPGRLVAMRVIYPPFPDSLVIPLCAHGLYYVAIWPGAAQLQVVPEVTGAAPTFAVRTREGSGMVATIVELHPIDFASHVFTVTAPPGVDHVRLWLWEDRATEDSLADRQRWSLHFGFGGSVGMSTAYAGGVPPPDDGDGPGGETVHGPEHVDFSPEANLLASSGPLTLAFGVNWDQRAGAADNITWGYVELRAEVAAFGPTVHRTGVELLARTAWGSSLDASIQPTALGVGAMLDRYLTRKTAMRGVRLTFAAMVLHLSDVGSLSPTTYLHLTAGIAVVP